MNTINIVRLTETAKSPAYANGSAAAADFFADEDKFIPAGQRRLVKTGIIMEIPEGYVGLLWDRSGMAYKNGLTRVAGVIDSDYRGEIGVILHNLTDSDYYIAKGDKIIQMVIQQAPQFNFEEVMELSSTERGANRFGSTGK